MDAWKLRCVRRASMHSVINFSLMASLSFFACLSPHCGSGGLGFLQHCCNDNSSITHIHIQLNRIAYNNPPLHSLNSSGAVKE